jgi:sugar phosphate isomerase/epimerase
MAGGGRTGFLGVVARENPDLVAEAVSLHGLPVATAALSGCGQVAAVDVHNAAVAEADQVHQHNEIGHGDIDWDETFAALGEVAFDGIAAVCVFGWEEDADAIHRRILDRVTSELAGPAPEPR